VLGRRSKSSAKARESDDSARIKANVHRAFGPPVDHQEVRDHLADLKKQRDIGLLTDLEYALKRAARLGVTSPANEPTRRSRKP